MPCNFFLFLIKFQCYMLYFIYFYFIFIYLSRVFCMNGGNPSKMPCPNSFPSFLGLKNCTNIQNLGKNYGLLKCCLCFLCAWKWHGSCSQFQFPSYLLSNLRCVQWEINTMEHGHIWWLPLHNKDNKEVSQMPCILFKLPLSRLPNFHRSLTIFC